MCDMNLYITKRKWIGNQSLWAVLSAVLIFLAFFLNCERRDNPPCSVSTSHNTHYRKLMFLDMKHEKSFKC